MAGSLAWNGPTSLLLIPLFWAGLLLILRGLKAFKHSTLYVLAFCYVILVVLMLIEWAMLHRHPAVFDL